MYKYVFVFSFRQKVVSEGAVFLCMSSVLGEWADEDYSVACMHAVDYRVVGGYNLSAANFQFDLYRRHVASGLQVNSSSSLPTFLSAAA